MMLRRGISGVFFGICVFFLGGTIGEVSGQGATMAAMAIGSYTAKEQVPEPIGVEMRKAYKFMSAGIPADIKADLEMVKVDDERCEVCQIAVHKLCDLMTKRMQRSSHKKGSIDIELQTLMESGDVCSYGTWMGMEKNSGVPLDRLVTGCQGFVDEVGEAIETTIPKYYMEEGKARRKLCVEETWACKVVELWGDNNHVLTRPDKPGINKRLSEAYSAWLASEDTSPYGALEPTASGLQYKLLSDKNNSEDAKFPTEADTVSVHYMGTTVDGRVFDSSFDRDEPSSFGVTQVIKGWQEGLQLLKEGEWMTFSIPPEIGYGPEGTSRIAGNEHLIFHVKLVAINPQSQKPEATESDSEDDKPSYSYPTTDGSQYEIPDDEL